MTLTKVFFLAVLSTAALLATNVSGQQTQYSDPIGTCGCDDRLMVRRLETIQSGVDQLVSAMGDTKSNCNTGGHCAAGCECLVDMLAWGWQDFQSSEYPTIIAARTGYIRLNWRNAYIGSDLGFMTAILNPFTCNATFFPRMNPLYGGLAHTDMLIDTINGLNQGDVFIGITGDEVQTNLSPAFPAFQSLGMDISSITHRGKFAFLAQKGFPSKTVLHLKGNNTIEGPSWLVVNIKGTTIDNVSFTTLVKS